MYNVHVKGGDIMIVYIDCKANGTVRREVETKEKGFMKTINYETRDGNVFSASIDRMRFEDFANLCEDFKMIPFDVRATVYKDTPQLNFWGPVEPNRKNGIEVESVHWDD